MSAKKGQFLDPYRRVHQNSAIPLVIGRDMMEV